MSGGEGTTGAPREGTIRSNGVELAWRRSGGPGPTLVLAHGVTDDGDAWLPIAEGLLPRYDIVRYDARGHGRSQATLDGYTPAVLADDLAGLISGLGLERPVVVGHSLGAVTAIVLGARHPELTRGVVLEDPPGDWWQPSEDFGFGGTPEPGATPVGEVERVRSQIAARRAMGREALVALSRAENPRWSDAECERWADAKLRVDPAVAAVFDRAGWTTVDWPAAILALRALPVLLVAGDPAAGSVFSERSAALFAMAVPGARIERIAGAGHSVHRDAPGRWLEIVLAFLAEVAPTT